MDTGLLLAMPVAHQIRYQDCHGQGDTPSLKGFWSASSNLVVFIGQPTPPVTETKQGPHVLHLLNTSPPSVEFMQLGSAVTCPIPDARTYRLSLWAYVPTQPDTVAGDFRVVVIWQDPGINFRLSIGTQLDQWEQHVFDDLDVKPGATSFQILLYNQGGSAFSPNIEMFVDRIEMYDHGDAQRAPATITGPDCIVDRGWDQMTRRDSAI